MYFISNYVINSYYDGLPLSSLHIKRHFLYARHHVTCFKYIFSHLVFIRTLRGGIIPIYR